MVSKKKTHKRPLLVDGTQPGQQWYAHPLKPTKLKGMPDVIEMEMADEPANPVRPLAQFIGKTESFKAKAGLTLQWLVKYAEARQTVTYGELGKRIGVNPHTVLPGVLGVIGGSLKKLRSDIPMIQLLVVNQKTKLPGELGLADFLIEDRQLLQRLSLKKRWKLWQVAREDIFAWDWRKVLAEFGLPPLLICPMPLQQLLEELEENLFGYASGEQEDHRRLKKYVADHPAVVDLKYDGSGNIEYTVLSGDRLDIFFDLPDQWVCVEVKAKHSPDWDILRGIFQCVKYKAVLEAQGCYVNNCGPYRKVRVVLVLGSELPHHLEPLRRLLDVEVKPNITVPDEQ